MKDFRQLAVWEKSHRLTLAVYKATMAFPREELYGLISQTRRASASIPTNIAEGCGRRGDAEFAQFCQIAMGSATELEYHFLLAHELGFMETTTYETLNRDLVEIKRMLNVFIQKLRS